MRIIFLLFLLIVATTVTGQIAGKVTDSNGEALPYVNIYLENTYVGTTTNEEGNF